jgi:2-methylcitrate dehydratase
MSSSPDPLLLEIAAYARDREIDSEIAYDTARLCLMDALACGLQALADPDCVRLLGPVVPGAAMVGGARVPGTSYELDPVRAAFNIGAMVRWLDAEDAWGAAEWGHPFDNLGGILAVADYLSRRAVAAGGAAPTVRDALTAMIKASEIQGTIAVESDASQVVGRGHAIMVGVASTAVTTALLGGSLHEVIDAVSNAWMDGGAQLDYRHGQGIGARRSWAAGDATSRGVWHALNAMRGEPANRFALSAPEWGFGDALDKGRPLACAAKFGCVMMANALSDANWQAEVSPLLFRKFDGAAAQAFPLPQSRRVRSLFDDPARLDRMRVDQFMAELVRN